MYKITVANQKEYISERQYNLLPERARDYIVPQTIAIDGVSPPNRKAWTTTRLPTVLLHISPSPDRVITDQAVPTETFIYNNNVITII